MVDVRFFFFINYSKSEQFAKVHTIIAINTSKIGQPIINLTF